MEVEVGIHYNFASKRGERAMLKEAKRKARLAQKKAKKLVSSEPFFILMLAPIFFNASK